MIEENKVWKHFTGYKNIEADPDSMVVLLIEREDGWRCLDHAIKGASKWKSAHDTPEEKIIGYYEVRLDSYTRCRHEVSEAIESIPTDFKGEAAVLWEFGRETEDGYEKTIEDAFKLSEVRESRVAYCLGHAGMKGPSYITGYHILPERFYAKFEDGTVKNMDFDPYRMCGKPKRKPKHSVEIKRQKDDTLKVTISKDGQRTTYPIDAPELEPYRGTIDFLKEQLLSMNAGTTKLSF